MNERRRLPQDQLELHAVGSDRGGTNEKGRPKWAALALTKQSRSWQIYSPDFLDFSGAASLLFLSSLDSALANPFSNASSA